MLRAGAAIAVYSLVPTARCAGAAKFRLASRKANVEGESPMLVPRAPNRKRNLVAFEKRYLFFSLFKRRPLAGRHKLIGRAGEKLLR